MIVPDSGMIEGAAADGVLSNGRTFEEAVYSVDGAYTFTEGEQRPAKLHLTVRGCKPGP